MRLNLCSGIGLLVILMVLAPVAISVADRDGTAIAELRNNAPVHAGATIHVPKDYPTIQQAINAASDGNQIVVAPGTYNEAIDFLGKSIHLVSSHGPDVTTFDGTGLGVSIATISGVNLVSATIDGFTFRDGSGTVVDDATLGGALFVSDSILTLRNSHFEDNIGTQGGAVMIMGRSDVHVENCTFQGNRAMLLPDNMRRGNAIANIGSSLSIENCEFIGNIGHIAVIGGTRGGAIYSGFNAALIVEESSFISNVAYRGGAIELGEGVAEVYHSLFEDNTGGGAGIRAGTAAQVQINHCHFLNNQAATVAGGRHGGALHVDGVQGAELTVLNSIFEGNSANRGGVAYLFGGEFRAVNCLFRGNSAYIGCIAVWTTSGGSGISVKNSTFVENSSGQFGVGSAIYVNSGSGVELQNSIAWSNTSPQISGFYSEPTVTYSLVQGGYAGIGNLNSNPHFASPSDGNYRLLPNSPAIDAGQNLQVPHDVTTDLDGNPRIVDGNDDGIAVVDMGAYEYQPLIVARLDIRPGSCPNPINPNSQGVLPVALLGIDEFDVTQVNLQTLALSRADGIGGSVTPNFGPPGPSPKIEDVATPLDGDDCECHGLGGDGIPDLSLKFWMAPLVGTLELDAEYSDTYIELVLTGEMNDGTPFIASDCVKIVGQPQNPNGQPALIPTTGDPEVDRLLDQLLRPSSSR